MSVRLSVGRLLLALVVVALPATAQTVVTPGNPAGWGGYTYDSAGNIAVWPGASAVISNTFPRSGNGSAELWLADEGTSESMWWLDRPSFGDLADLDALSFDWLVGSSSTTPAHTTVAFALYINSASYLVWEGIYNGYGNPTPDTWYSSDIAGDNFWWDGRTMTGECARAASYKSLSWFNSTCFGGTARVDGIAIFLGYGASGTQFSGAIDNVAYGFAAGPAESFNFELDESATVPEPATLTLMATGLAGLAASRRKRHR